MLYLPIKRIKLRKYHIERVLHQESKGEWSYIQDAFVLFLTGDSQNELIGATGIFFLFKSRATRLYTPSQSVGW